MALATVFSRLECRIKMPDLLMLSALGYTSALLCGKVRNQLRAGFRLTWGEELGMGAIGMYGILLHRFGGYSASPSLPFCARAC